MTQLAHGTFEVQLTPRTAEGSEPDTGLGRLRIEKQFAGDLEGTSHGEMLSAATSVEGSAGYVALERVTGTLHGRRGSFVLQHSGLLSRGVPQLTITVVPDSGTEELRGLAGQMSIRVEGGRHIYALEYELEGG